MPFAEVHRCTQGQSYEHTSLSTKRIRVRKRGRGKYVERAKRTSTLLGTSRGSGTGLRRRKGMERTKKRGWASSTYSNQCIRYTRREDDSLSIVDSISEASGQLTHPRSPARRLQGHGSLNMKYAPLIVHG